MSTGSNYTIFAFIGGGSFNIDYNQQQNAYFQGWAKIKEIRITFTTPVLLIHGLNPPVIGKPVDIYWKNLITALDAAGIKHHEFDYGTGLEKGPEGYAQDLQEWINGVRSQYDPPYTGKFDIVCYSYGAMVSRWYMENEGGAKDIRQWIGIAPVNHGAAVADKPSIDPISYLGYLIPGDTPAIQAVKTKSDQLAVLNYKVGKFDIAKWKTSPETLASGVKYRVLAAVGHMTDCVNKDSRGLYYFRTDRGDKWVPLFQSQLQNVGTDCFYGPDHITIINDPTVISRVITYLKYPDTLPLNNFPKSKDPYDHRKIMTSPLHILLD